MMASFLPFTAVIFALLPVLCLTHSIMTDPQSISPMECRLGGAPFGVGTCPGPCDLRAIEGGYSNFASPDNPARTYRRGQDAVIKYTRNNHGPGGFIRLTMVRPEDIMDKEAHASNAFFYTCWGGNPVVARPDECASDQFGYSFVGSDGEQHEFPKGYYEIQVKIPECIPDGNYVLGWAWYGGTGSVLTGNVPQRPGPYGFFSDYWSCAFVRIEGGSRLRNACEPIFVNDMTQFSTDGCMAMNDRLGICTHEPCFDMGHYQLPFEFKDGRKPAALTPDHFRGILRSPVEDIPEEETDGGREMRSIGESRAACLCLNTGRRCSRRLAGQTGGVCQERTVGMAQDIECKNVCCDRCRMPPRVLRRICRRRNVARVCSQSGPMIVGHSR